MLDILIWFRVRTALELNWRAWYETLTKRETVIGDIPNNKKRQINMIWFWRVLIMQTVLAQTPPP